MVGTRKQADASKAKRFLNFKDRDDLVEPGNGKQTLNSKRSKGEKRKRNANLPKTSPRKLAKVKKGCKDDKLDDRTVQVAFHEEDSEVVLEVREIDGEFPMESKVFTNNNATVASQGKLGKKEKKGKVSPRVQRFRDMVAMGTAMGQAPEELHHDRSSSDRTTDEGQTSTEEGETQSSDDDLVTSSVKILPQRPEDVAWEEAEY